jgi:hypothetical protein
MRDRKRSGGDAVRKPLTGLARIKRDEQRLIALYLLLID